MDSSALHVYTKTNTNTRNFNFKFDFNIHTVNSVEFNWNKWRHFELYCNAVIFFSPKSWYYLQMSMSNWILDLIMYVFICIFNLPQDSWRRLRAIFATEEPKKKTLRTFLIIIPIENRMLTRVRVKITCHLYFLNAWLLFQEEKLNDEPQFNFKVWYKCLHCNLYILSINKLWRTWFFFLWSINVGANVKVNEEENCKMKNLLQWIWTMNDFHVEVLLPRY